MNASAYINDIIKRYFESDFIWAEQKKENRSKSGIVIKIDLVEFSCSVCFLSNTAQNEWFIFVNLAFLGRENPFATTNWCM